MGQSNTRKVSLYPTLPYQGKSLSTSVKSTNVNTLSLVASVAAVHTSLLLLASPTNMSRKQKGSTFCWKWVWKNNNWATWGLIKSVTHTPKMSGPRTNAFSSARSVTWYIYLFKSIKYWMRKLTPKSPTSNGIFEETWYKLTINTLSHIRSVRGMWRVYILNFCTMRRSPRGTPSL